MEELLEVTRKQLKMQKLISLCLAVMVAALLIGGGILIGHMNRMAGAIEQMSQKVESIDIDSLNGTIQEMENMMESVDAFSEAVDQMTGQVEEFSAWLSGIWSAN